MCLLFNFYIPRLRNFLDQYTSKCGYFYNTRIKKAMVLRIQRNVLGICCPLLYHEACSGSSLSTFRDNPSFPEYRRSHLNRGGSLKSRVMFLVPYFFLLANVLLCKYVDKPYKS
jgi:hypothetical protein